MTSIAVVIPCRNEAQTIVRLLDALAAQTRPPDQIVVVNDASTDGTVDVVGAWARAHPGVPTRVVDAPRRGAGAAMNAGIAAADAEIIVRLDGHSLPCPEYLHLSAQTLDAPGAGVAGGVWRLEPGGHGAVARGIALALTHPLGSGGADYRHPSAGGGRVRPVDTVPFGAFRRALWVTLGGFDETLLRNQDYDFNYRVRLAGLTVLLNPAIVSVYRARGTLGALSRQYFHYGYWKVQTVRKHPRSLRPRAFVPMLLVPALVAFGVWVAATGSALALALVAAYPAVMVAAAAFVTLRARTATLLPGMAAALVVLQTSWSVGATVAFLSPRPVARERTAS